MTGAGAGAARSSSQPAVELVRRANDSSRRCGDPENGAAWAERDDDEREERERPRAATAVQSGHVAPAAGRRRPRERAQPRPSTGSTNRPVSNDAAERERRRRAERREGERGEDPCASHRAPRRAGRRDCVSAWFQAVGEGDARRVDDDERARRACQRDRLREHRDRRRCPRARRARSVRRDRRVRAPRRRGRPAGGRGGSRARSPAGRCGRSGRPWRARSITSWRGSPPVPRTSPLLVTTSTRRWRRTSRATTDAAASTATSNDSGVVAVGMHVEHDRGLRAPAGFVLADHQLTGARGRSPVHAAQVVAELVVAQGEELVAEVAHHRRAPRRPRCSPRDPAADRDGRDDLVRPAGERAPRLSSTSASDRRASPNGSVAAHDERADPVPATSAGGDAVRGARGGTRRRAAGRGSVPRAAPRRTSRWRRAGEWRVSRGSRS